MNAETRAKEIANRLDGANPREWNRIIAQAIRQAENDKLEEAAVLIESEIGSVSPSWVPDLVRSLISQKD